MESFTGLGLILGIFVGVVSYIISCKVEERRLKKSYCSLQIGDRYQTKIYYDNPFREIEIFKATIIGKGLDRWENPWVKYRFDDGSIDCDRYDRFLSKFTPIKDDVKNDGCGI